MITTIITTIVSAINNIFTKYTERKEKEQELYLAREEARIELAKETIKAELERGNTQIKATGKYFKYFSFFMWFGPFMSSFITPVYGIMVFENLKLLPEWYVQSCMVIMFAIWGISAGRETIANIFSGLGNFFHARYKFNINRKLFYDTLRSTKGPISQHEVDLFEKVLDRLEDKGK